MHKKFMRRGSQIFIVASLPAAEIDRSVMGQGELLGVMERRGEEIGLAVENLRVGPPQKMSSPQKLALTDMIHVT